MAKFRCFTISLFRYFLMRLIAFTCFSFLLIASCTDSYTPKPRGYFRIDLPERSYRVFDTTFPFTFEYPGYAEISADSSKMAEPYWINIRYKPFNATLHFSYKVVNGNLEKYLDDARTLVNKHIPKANAISQREFIDPANRVFGLVYDIRGADAASPYQFYLTDSITEFVRGALYFNHVPNNDSLAPVIDFLKSDMEHMISTFRWKNKATKAPGHKGPQRK
ncbi:MAG: gliding motility lipoprotein GldD [Bacteroidetes bacterium]|nr:gliding motility lipoprotein GldD [Bacteroidota bacterium]